LDQLRTAFEERFGRPPTVVVRAPGRVNLIGEHTDYSHLPVLPMAIERAVTLAAAPASGDAVTVVSTAFEGEARLERLNLTNGTIPWHRYVAGALHQLADLAPAHGADVFVGSDLPWSGGLSSSSAFTTGLIAALAAAWETPLDPEDLVRRAIVAERHSGVESGGMDQAVIVFAQAGHALRIDFDPPTRRLVPIPAGLAFVAASSGEDAPKGGAARDAYNERVVGARLAAAMLADQVGLDIGAPPFLREVAGVDVVELLVDDLPEKVSAREVAHGVDVDVEHLVRLTADRWDPVAKVPVRRVARHILGEAARVDEAEAALLAGELEAFGELLDASHNSLRQDLRCSTAALDRLCAAMRKAGAYGARLTGAGFGGFALAAVRPERVAQVIAAAEAATGGPAFEVNASAGLTLV
jgi:galactokinase